MFEARLPADGRVRALIRRRAAIDCRRAAGGGRSGSSTRRPPADRGGHRWAERSWSGMHAQRRHIEDIRRRVQAPAGPPCSRPLGLRCPEYYPAFDYLHVASRRRADELIAAWRATRPGRPPGWC